MADAGLTLFLIPLLVVVGFIGFFVIIITLIFRAIGRTIRAVFGKPADPMFAMRHNPSRMRLCGHVRCGHANPLKARYCARCGHKLDYSHEDTAHG